MLGPDALGNANVDGLFLDDFWSNFPYKLPWATNPARDCSLSATGGPSEIAGGCVGEMGLSAADVQDIAENWLETMHAVPSALHAVAPRGGRSTRAALRELLHGWGSQIFCILTNVQY